MIWFFMFTTIGMAIYAFLSTLKKAHRLTFGNLLKNSLLLMVCGALVYSLEYR